jgi:hypothetical protein
MLKMLANNSNLQWAMTARRHCRQARRKPYSAAILIEAALI